MKYDAVVVGGGIAGLTAAAYVARAGKSVVLFERQAKLGGLVQTFERDQVYFDGGLRSIENSGVVFPMLKQLGIDIEFRKSPISIGIADSVLKLREETAIEDYELFLKEQYPDNKSDIEAIILEIRKIMKYMEVLYAIDNPAFLDFKKDRDYLIKKILPWMFKFLVVIGKINKLNEPADEYLQRFTKNQALIDIIAQHFFQKTPASFALSYFSLYLDYHYPKGGTAVLISKLTDYLLAHGVVIKTETLVTALNPELKTVTDSNGDVTEYGELVWAGDMKQLYNNVDANQLKNKSLADHIKQKQVSLRPLKGSDSIFTVFLTVNEHKDYFDRICTGHFFYTPDKRGLSIVDKSPADAFISMPLPLKDEAVVKQQVKQYIRDYIFLNTFEVAIPCLRDPDLAPEGKAGVVISLLFDYDLSRKLEEAGWMGELKPFIEECIVDAIDQSIFPGFKAKIALQFSSSPLTIQKMTGNTEGSITGWAFTNAFVPAVNKMLQVSKSVDTRIPSVYQAGQWTYSPAGLPMSVVTGKLAADKVLKNLPT